MAKSLGEILNELLQRNGLTHRVKQFEVINAWPEVVGPAVARVSKAAEVREGVLYVEVLNGVWRNELFYLKPELVQKLNRHVGQKVIHDIHLV